MKFCSRCGTQLEDNDVFCPSCGEVCDRTDVNNTNNYRNTSQNNRHTISKRDKNASYAKLGYIGIALSSVFMLINIATSILNIINH